VTLLPARRAVFDADHEALRDSVAKFLATEPADFLAGAAEYGFLNLGDVDDPRFAAVVLEAAMEAGRPELALTLAMHDSFAVPLLAGTTAALAAVVDEGEVRAEPTGDGWRLHGSADGVVNGLGAELLVVRAVSSVGSDGASGVGSGDGSDPLFVVRAADVQRVPAAQIRGLECLDLADLAFAGVGAEPLTGDLTAARARHHLALAVAAVAGARAALRITVDYVGQRKAFGKPIATFENTRHALGTLGARIAAVEAFVDSCLTGTPGPATAAAAKFTATELLGAAVDQGVQLHGGYGYMWEYPIARAYAAARFFRLHGEAGENLTEVLAGSVGL
jgi:acyl-CoA dehydrogenase